MRNAAPGERSSRSEITEISLRLRNSLKRKVRFRSTSLRAGFRLTTHCSGGHVISCDGLSLEAYRFSGANGGEIRCYFVPVFDADIAWDAEVVGGGVENSLTFEAF